MRAFISYSHKDHSHLAPFLTHLKPVAAEYGIELWCDEVLETGDDWKQEILDHIDRADLFFPLVTANFIASDFIVDEELPPMLKRSGAGGALLLPVIVRRCSWAILFGSIQATPRGPRGLLPIADWKPHNNGYHCAAEQIGSAIRKHLASTALTLAGSTP